ncbi:MAG: ABC transporter ATP-binding protein [Pseudomonadota bacterium]
MARVELRNIVKAFGATQVLRNVSLDVDDGEFMTLIGASGCGKSTLLRIVAGLEAQGSGSVRIGERMVDHLRPRQRRIAMVFQSYALYPHMTVRENIATPLMIDRTLLAERLPLVGRLSPRRRRIAGEIDQAVRGVAELLQIEPLLDRRPGQLSGGQRQRAALGRAMVREPQVFLMDEPLSNLDASLRVHMRRELADLHRRLGATFIYVTHDQVEAMTMSGRVALMEAGEILQVGTPNEVYHRPANTRVAAFLGSPRINLLEAAVEGAGTLRLGGTALAHAAEAAGQGSVTLGIRPESIALTGDDPAGQGGLSLLVDDLEDLGHEIILHARLETEGAPAALTARLPAAAVAAARAAGRFGNRIRVEVDPASLLIFDRDGLRIPATVAPAAPAAAHPQAAAG